MKRGEVRQDLRTTQPEQPTEPFLEEAVSQLAAELDVDPESLFALGARITYQQLGSRHNPDIPSDDLLVILWFHDEPVALSLETRTEMQLVRTQQVYFGPREIDGP